MRILTPEEQRLQSNIIDFFSEVNIKVFRRKPMTTVTDIAFMNYLTTQLTGYQIKLAILRLITAPHASELNLKRINAAIVLANNQWDEQIGDWRWRYVDSEDASREEQTWARRHRLLDDWNSHEDNTEDFTWILERDPDVAPAMFYVAFVENHYVPTPKNVRLFKQLVDALEAFLDARDHPFDHTGELAARKFIIKSSQTFGLLREPQLKVET
jgi:hypothetical protein